ncbi:PEP-CTERM sorting domain-containing protein [Noviherbaspirillum galbum]|uniref:PEP-CTERM sorting domain-containing protein n=1 Tax=Noviherbaspirillum galbum TaxID=2709383 RepID=A0A6B3SS05_9BURK|nr:PEP-CTERM sorting domain-containing protein [Noviherbaspirillum galbum]NEX63533.1 PEP-CTERM sorting domain-containing protein [Noviherbaspirillum galbum]
MKVNSLLKAAVLAAAAFGVQAANAALVSCPSSFVTDPTAKVEDSTGTHTAASACQYLTPADSSNVASISNINAAGFFGHSDWTGNGSNLQIEAASSAGTWAITGANFAANDYIIVFKDGSDTNLVAFLLNELYSSGTWTTPFTSAIFNFNGNSQSHNVSHYTIAQRSNPSRVPEPAPLALLGLGALAFTMARRRKDQC